MFVHENNRNYNSYIFSYKFAFSIIFSFLTNQKHEYGFQQVGSLVTRNISAFLFIASCALFQSHAEFNEFLKRNFRTCYSCSYYSSMFIYSKFRKHRNNVNNFSDQKAVSSENISFVKIEIVGSSNLCTKLCPNTLFPYKSLIYIALKFHFIHFI